VKKVEQSNVDEVLTVKEVADLLKVKPSWVYDRISPKHGGRLPHIRLGRYIRFERFAVLDFLRRQRKGYLASQRNTGVEPGRISPS
jgi:excisionase family DNA binding protein